MLEVMDCGGEGIESDKNVSLDWMKVGGVVGGGVVVGSL